MPARRWTILIVPPAAGESRSLTISLVALRVTLGIVAVIAAAALGLGYTSISKAIALSQLDRIERRNELLTQELDRTEALLAVVADTIEAISKQDLKVRLLAGLEPTDPGVQQAGIGGPIGKWTEDEQILSESVGGRRMLAMRTDLATLIRRASLLANSFDAAADSLDAHVDLLKRTPSIRPTKGWQTSLFSQQRMHPIYHDDRPHEGIDIAAQLGTPILAPAAGIVKSVFQNSGYGLMVVIDHGDGVVTRYAHCDKALVRTGQRVSRGEKIALVGRSGIATAPHLHYEVLLNGRPQDPLKYIFHTIVD